MLTAPAPSPATVNDPGVRALLEVGVDVTDQPPKAITSAMARGVDLVPGRGGESRPDLGAPLSRAGTPTNPGVDGVGDSPLEVVAVTTGDTFERLQGKPRSGLARRGSTASCSSTSVGVSGSITPVGCEPGIARVTVSRLHRKSNQDGSAVVFRHRLILG